MFTEHLPRCRNRARPRDGDSGHGFLPRCSAVWRTGRTASRHLPVRPRRADHIQCAFGGGTVPSSFWFFFIFFKWVVHCHNDIFYLKIYDLFYIFFALPFSYLIPPAPQQSPHCCWTLVFNWEPLCPREICGNVCRHFSCPELGGSNAGICG